MKLNKGIKAIAEHYGLAKQLIKLAEECSEYSAALIKETILTRELYADENPPKRYRQLGKIGDARYKADSELADVLVLTRQIEYFLRIDPEFKEYIESIMAEKVKRQLKRIDREQEDVKEADIND